MEQHDKVRAILRPLRTDDLKPEVLVEVGKEAEFYAAWIIDHECDYKGDWAMAPTLETVMANRYRGVVWVPLCDLEILVDENGGVAKLKAEVGPEVSQPEPALRPKDAKAQLAALLAEGEKLAPQRAEGGLEVVDGLSFPRALSEQERLLLDRHLAEKYGLKKEKP